MDTQTGAPDPRLHTVEVDTLLHTVAVDTLPHTVVAVDTRPHTVVVADTHLHTVVAVDTPLHMEGVERRRPHRPPFITLATWLILMRLTLLAMRCNKKTWLTAPYTGQPGL